MSFHYIECKKNETHWVGWWFSGARRWGRRGDVGQRVQTLSCEMSASWGGVCSTLTIVNPVLLLHAGNSSRVHGQCCHHIQNMGLWTWWMCCLVVCDKYFMVYTCHRVYGICIHNPFISRFSPIRHAPPPSDALLRFSCGSSPQECAQSRRWFRSGSCIERQGS